MGAKLAGEENGVGKDEGVEENQVLDHWQQQPGAVEPEDAYRPRTTVSETRHQIQTQEY